jgi:hypothetical protein
MLSRMTGQHTPGDILSRSNGTTIPPSIEECSLQAWDVDNYQSPMFHVNKGERYLNQHSDETKQDAFEQIVISCG